MGLFYALAIPHSFLLLSMLISVLYMYFIQCEGSVYYICSIVKVQENQRTDSTKENQRTDSTKTFYMCTVSVKTTLSCLLYVITHTSVMVEPFIPRD